MDGHRLLVVDDDPEFLRYVAGSLSRAGFSVSKASSAKSAKRALAESRFSVLLADLRLPDGTGFEILAEARKRDPLCVGVILTGHGSVDTALEALREGAFDYLFKPCEPQVLVAAARRAAEHHALKKALVEKTAQLEKVQSQLDDRAKLIQNVSHELKNPLSVVYGYSSFLLKQRDECRPEDIERSLNSIHNNAERLNHLLEELTESTRLGGRRVQLDKKPVAASKLVEDAVGHFSVEADRRGVSLSAGSSCAEAVSADARRVHQVLSNLLANAFKFTPAGGRIEVSARDAGGAVEFRVRDTGCGVSEEDLPHLFERFYQASMTRAKHAGMGLGLDISKGLVELHGGRIWAESRPGQGAAFFFTLPKAEALARSGG